MFVFAAVLRGLAVGAVALVQHIEPYLQGFEEPRVGGGVRIVQFVGVFFEIVEFAFSGVVFEVQMIRGPDGLEAGTFLVSGDLFSLRADLLSPVLWLRVAGQH